MRLKDVEIARVLLVDDDPASRLTLKTVLEAGGYTVDSAASAAEAFGKMDEREYELILTDMQLEVPEAGLRVLQHARAMNYRPATALVTSSTADRSSGSSSQRMLVETEDVPGLLGKIADLIALRATRRVAREMRVAGA